MQARRGRDGRPLFLLNFCLVGFFLGGGGVYSLLPLTTDCMSPVIQASSRSFSVRFFTWNIKGLNNLVKRSKIFSDLNPDIVIFFTRNTPAGYTSFQAQVFISWGDLSFSF